MTDDLRVITGPLSQREPSFFQQHSESVNQTFGILHDGTALKPVVHIKMVLHCIAHFLLWVTVVNDMLLKGECYTTRAARRPAGKDIPLVDCHWGVTDHVPPYESEEGFVLRQQAYLVEHPLNVASKGNCVLPEA